MLNKQSTRLKAKDSHNNYKNTLISKSLVRQYSNVSVSCGSINQQFVAYVFLILIYQNVIIVTDEQRRIYGSEGGEELPRYASSPQRQASPFPHESTNRRFYRRNRNSKGKKILHFIYLFQIIYEYIPIAL